MLQMILNDHYWSMKKFCRQKKPREDCLLAGSLAMGAKKPSFTVLYDAYNFHQYPVWLCNSLVILSNSWLKWSDKQKHVLHIFSYPFSTLLVGTVKAFSSPKATTSRKEVSRTRQAPHRKREGWAVRFPARLFHGERQVPLAIQRAINHLHPFARCFRTKSLLAILQDRCKIRNRFEFIIVEQLIMCFGKYKGAEKWMIAVQLRLIVTDPGIEQPLRFFTAPADPPNRTLPQTTYIQLYTFSISYITWKKPQVDSRPTATKIIAQHSRTGLGAKHGLHWWRRRPALKSADHWSRWMKSWHELRFSDTPGHING